MDPVAIPIPQFQHSSRVNSPFDGKKIVPEQNKAAWFLQRCKGNKLDISNTGVDKDDIAALVEFLAANNTITEVDLNRNRICDVAAQNLGAAHFTLKHVSVLDVSNNQIKGNGVKALLLFASLRELNLSLNGITEETLVSDFLQNTSLVKLELFGNATIIGNNKAILGQIEKNRSVSQAAKEPRQQAFFQPQNSGADSKKAEKVAAAPLAPGASPSSAASN